MSSLPPPPHFSCKKCLRWVFLGNFIVTGESLGTCTITEVTTSEHSVCAGFRLKREEWELETCGTCLYFESVGDPEEACGSSGGSAEADDKACTYWVTKEETDFTKKLTNIKERYIQNDGKLLTEEEVLNLVKKRREGETFDQFVQEGIARQKAMSRVLTDSLTHINAHNKSERVGGTDDHEDPICLNCISWTDYTCNNILSRLFGIKTWGKESCPSFLGKGGKKE